MLIYGTEAWAIYKLDVRRIWRVGIKYVRTAGYIRVDYGNNLDK
jgi:hypothetical protein